MISDTLTFHTAYDEFYRNYKMVLYDSLDHTLSLIKSLNYSASIIEVQDVVELKHDMLLLQTTREFFLLARVRSGHSYNLIGVAIYNY